MCNVLVSKPSNWSSNCSETKKVKNYFSRFRKVRKFVVILFLKHIQDVFLVETYWLVQGPDEQMFVCFDSCRKFLCLEKVNLAYQLEYGPLRTPFIPQVFVCVGKVLLRLPLCCFEGMPAHQVVMERKRNLQPVLQHLVTCLKCLQTVSSYHCNILNVQY